ncbi:bifunctional 4-hydroxy-2-oxoglutarate aldolase/2-dehydro-3-deoxy-phosphogluconate aldolase [Ferrovibrio sp.]|uniref:bifunctional 4-hydroxy-2-oxoglutarate aldolase/2-dehydro-3-deoxy-phosphogluconate aldolase n=1 Tax=Ferrovibrio sp. TaxID=1917215 RepID=UPI0026386C19|nr:bifunctional 4-hydroxy-2-oxoglutarate aldolase/2-dehydro-3-deoxy-phosphogluconate aldolase [Ferrovibrio sp.]
MPDKATEKTVERTAAIDAILSRAPVIPVLVVEDATQAVPLAKALVAGGLSVLEITLRSAAALEAIKRIAAEVPEAVVGAGTVLNAAQFAAAQLAGAKFVISPGATDALYYTAKDTGLPYLPAVATASEVMRALEQGFTRAKFFPAEAMGGIRALQSLAGPFPQMRFCPTGGITEANLAAYAALPNVASVGGSWLAPADKLAAGDWAGITAIAKRAVQIAKGA